MSDPVHQVTVPEEDERGFTWSPGWYFWDETWSDRLGPYDSRDEADEACTQYAEQLGVAQLNSEQRHKQKEDRDLVALYGHVILLAYIIGCVLMAAGLLVFCQ